MAKKTLGVLVLKSSNTTWIVFSLRTGVPMMVLDPTRKALPLPTVEVERPCPKTLKACVRRGTSMNWGGLRSLSFRFGLSKNLRCSSSGSSPDV